jgi:hypothetical protein
MQYTIPCTTPHQVQAIVRQVDRHLVVIPVVILVVVIPVAILVVVVVVAILVVVVVVAVIKEKAPFGAFIFRK